MPSIKRNFIYSSILTVSNYLFPLLTFPYVTRVLGVTNLGICNFIDSIVSYFMIFSMLGIGTVGIREISRAKNDHKELSHVFSSLLTINIIITFIAIAGLLIGLYYIPQLQEQKMMIYIGCIRLLFNSLLIEWLYKGLENFKYITIRSIFVKCLYIISVLLFVKQASDYVIYFGLTASMIIVNAIINLLHSRSFVRYTRIGLSFKPYLKPLIVLGAYQVLTSFYTSFNVMYLGFVAGETEVGYYTVAVKLYTIILSIFTAFTGVMLPRMSSLVADDKIEEFKTLANKSISLLFAFAMPLIVLSTVYAPQIINIIAGDGYTGSILPMRIVMPLMLIIGYEQIIIIQMLAPLRKDKAMLKNSAWGGGVAILMNILLVSRLRAIGSSLVWIISEIVVLISAQYHVNRYIGFNFPVKRLFDEFLYFAPILVVNIILNYYLKGSFGALISGAIITTIYYFIIICFVIKNEVINSNINSILKRWNVHFQLP